MLSNNVEINAGAPVQQAVRAVWVRTSTEPQLPSTLRIADSTIALSSITPDAFGAFLSKSQPIAVVILQGSDESVQASLAQLRERVAFERTRVFISRKDHHRLAADQGGRFDIEDYLPEEPSLTEVTSAIERGVRAFRALGTNPLVPHFYLEATHNKVFDWFETTRWHWNEVGDLSKIDRSLLTEDEIEILKESAIIEFGTLPGAHNFLREWEDEYSFSSWALSWGAEEARHSLLQCRYLSELGIEIPSKHAMYKREPYPIGYTRSGTLMMNIISEARAAEYYRALANTTKEPILARIWSLLGRDEARHARAFYVFCKELCELDKDNAVKSHTIAALEMCYVFLADRSRGVKHPAGHFYPHSTSTSGLRMVEEQRHGVTDAADQRVLAMVRNLTNNDGIHTVRDLKTQLRSLVS